jgi:hypothetical protein
MRVLAIPHPEFISLSLDTKMKSARTFQKGKQTLITKHQYQAPMANVSKHHSELKGKCHDGEYSWIYFAVTWNPVQVNYSLKVKSKHIGLNICRNHLPFWYLFLGQSHFS